MGDRTEVEADDLDKLTFLTQVRKSLIVVAESLCTFKVLEETLRLHPPGSGVGRQSPPGGMTLCGYTIPPGVQISVRN